MKIENLQAVFEMRIEEIAEIKSEILFKLFKNNFSNLIPRENIFHEYGVRESYLQNHYSELREGIH